MSKSTNSKLLCLALMALSAIADEGTDVPSSNATFVPTNSTNSTLAPTNITEDDTPAGAPVWTTSSPSGTGSRTPSAAGTSAPFFSTVSPTPSGTGSRVPSAATFSDGTAAPTPAGSGNATAIPSGNSTDIAATGCELCNSYGAIGNPEALVIVPNPSDNGATTVEVTCELAAAGLLSRPTTPEECSSAQGFYAAPCGCPEEPQEDDSNTTEFPTFAPTFQGLNDLVWAVCGDVNDEFCAARESAPELVVGIDELHEVRCCSDIELPNWTQLENCSVWATSQVGADETCNFGKTFAEAEFACFESNSRLCTRDEVFDGCTFGTGCGLDTDLIWTSTQATGPFDIGMWVATGTGNEARLELNETAEYRFRCCSDVDIAGWLNVDESCDIWTTSQIPTCQSGTWDYANSTCAENGGRMCTKQELMDACTEGTGCNFDNFFMWTSDIGYLSTVDQFAEEPDKTTLGPNASLAFTNETDDTLAPNATLVPTNATDPNATEVEEDGWMEINFEDFEDGETNFWTPGSFLDSRLGTGLPSPNDPTVLSNAVILQKNNGADSSMSTIPIDVLMYPAVRLNFQFFTELMGGDGFYFEIHTNLSEDFGVLRFFKEGVDYMDSNDTVKNWYDESVNIDVSNPNIVQLRLRLRCAAINGGMVYIDHLSLAVQPTML